MIGWMAMMLMSAGPEAALSLQSVQQADPRETPEQETAKREKKDTPKVERREKKSDSCRRSIFTQRCRIGSAPAPFLQ